MERKTGRGARRAAAKEATAPIPEEASDLLGEESAAVTEVEQPEETAGDALAEFAAEVPVQVVAVLGKKTIAMREILELRQGQVLDLHRPPNEVVDLVANGKLVARGELVEIDGSMGVRIIKMVK